MSQLRKWIENKEGVFLSSYLKKQGIPNSSIQSYYKKGQIKSLGYGAWYFGEGKPNLFEGISALQYQSRVPVHIGGLSSLILQGKTHYVYLNPKIIELFTPIEVDLPQWFLNHHWDIEIDYVRTSFLPKGLGLHGYQKDNISILKSSKERAYFESLYLTPKRSDLYEVFQNMEMLWGNKVDIPLIQQLLENCRSIKVKRLFLCFADYINHSWFQKLDLEKIYLGKGYCDVIHGGTYEPKYKVSIPSELYRTEMNTEGGIIW
ncbi:MAG: type IV toxin-antitoxin system AbiEi family antitoxin domain-containing protein [Flavobacteriaceae bacterium]|nr:type IV toxin-antitoxin system AbiEi family antitoxin domain-containing protein [Flavobacteriaceae bacterium]MCY4268183.1 type IV toxin-antitoxin system AbiEi family antitoxin domain-containing protein [Flavobacteriaceae bacterium]